MIDSTLSARLRTLRQDLQRAIDLAWLLQAGLGGNDVRPEVWQYLQATIGVKAKEQELEIQRAVALLKEARANKDPSAAEQQIKDAWTKYNGVRQDSQELFNELLDFIGGLAFRDRGLDEKLCVISDELIRTCSSESIGGKWLSVTVATRREAVGKTLARIIRLRFPERTIWTLPFAAHEFGHVVMSDVPGFDKFIAAKATEWAKRGAITGTRRLTRMRAELHLDELCADAFATYYMGPSYPCAAIHLRLSPGPVVEDDYPSDLKRAHVILGMLQRMNEDAGDPPVYKPVIEELESEWDLAVRRSGATALDTAETKRLDKLVADLWAEFDLRLIASALYPTSVGGWNVAESWRLEWTAKYGKGDKLTIPSTVPYYGKLRDALNAAWMFRLFHQESQPVSEVGKAALDLCQVIIQAQVQSQPPPTAATATLVTPGGS